jgi:hypothetical protein
VIPTMKERHRWMRNVMVTTPPYSSPCEFDARPLWILKN